jgi:type IV pilus assembly protein PilW
MKKQHLARITNRGFTLAELLIGLFVSGIVMTAILSAYYSQNKSYAVQEQVAAMVQNLRAAMDIMIREIRMAGYDPMGTANAGFVSTTTTSITITEDLDGDGSVAGDENITYALADSDGDGDNDLERNNNLIAENIDALDFVYLDENDTPTGVGSEIRSVQITIVAKTDKVDRGYHDTIVYTRQGGAGIFGPTNDGFRRKRLTAEVRCRNLGL